MKPILFVLFFIPLLMAQNIANYKMTDIDGNTVELKNNLDHDALVLVFWATWCKPCKMEFPKIQQVLDDNPGLDIGVLAVSTDTPRSLAKVKAFVSTQDYDFNYMLDPDGEMCSRLMIDTIPHTIVLDREGNIVYIQNGFRDGDEKVIEKEILNLTSKPEDNE